MTGIAPPLACRPLVVPLLQGCGPAAIPRLVIAVIVDAVDAVMRRWARPHIFNKSSEGVPALAESYSSATPVSKARRLRIIATLLHRAPYIVFGRAVAAVLRVKVSSEATTASYQSASQMTQARSYFGAALAFSNRVPAPVRLPSTSLFACAWSALKADNRQSSEFLAAQRFVMLGVVPFHISNFTTNDANWGDAPCS